MTENPDDSLGRLLVRLAEAPDDEDAWHKLYRQMRPFVLAVTFRKLRGNRALAEDAAQEVFIRLARYLPFDKFKQTKDFRRYLYVVAQNTATTYLSQIIRHEASVSDRDFSARPVADAPDPAEQMLLDEMEKDILGALDERDRKMVSMLMKGYTFAEIVVATGATYSSAGTRLYRVRERLRKFLDARNVVFP